MIPLNYLKVLKRIYHELNNSEVDWVVTGSISFALQGVPNIDSHNDIDIQTNMTGAYEIEKRFSDFSFRKVVFSSSEKVRSYYGALMIDGIEVEIMGDIQKKNENGSWTNPINLGAYKKIITFEGLDVPVLSLEYECQAYIELGRTKEAKRLSDFMNNKSHE